MPALIVGGSGLHFRALVDPLEFPPGDAEVRAIDGKYAAGHLFERFVAVLRRRDRALGELCSTKSEPIRWDGARLDLRLRGVSHSALIAGHFAGDSTLSARVEVEGLAQRDGVFADDAHRPPGRGGQLSFGQLDALCPRRGPVREIDHAVLVRPDVGLIGRGERHEEQAQQDDNRSCFHALSIAA